MSTVKGKYTFPSCDVDVRFTLHLLCDEADDIVTALLHHVGEEVWHFTRERRYSFEDIEENRALIERVLLKSQLVSHRERGFLGVTYTHSPVSQFASKVDLEFTKVVEEKEPRREKRSHVVVLSPPPEPTVHEVIKYIEKPDPPKKTIADKVTERIEEKADRLVSLAKATEELLKRYAPEMERDPELARALNNLVEVEKIRAFDS